MHFREAYPSGFELAAVAVSQQQQQQMNNNNNSSDNHDSQARARSFNRSGFSTQQDMSKLNSILKFKRQFTPKGQFYILSFFLERVR